MGSLSARGTCTPHGKRAEAQSSHQTKGRSRSTDSGRQLQGYNTSAYYTRVPVQTHARVGIEGRERQVMKSGFRVHTFYIIWGSVAFPLYYCFRGNITEDMGSRY